MKWGYFSPRCQDLTAVSKSSGNKYINSNVNVVVVVDASLFLWYCRGLKMSIESENILTELISTVDFALGMDAARHSHGVLAIMRKL